MSVAVGDFVRLTAKMKLFGTDDVMNVYTFRVDRNDSVDDDDFMDQAALFMDISYTLINPDMTDELTYISVDGQNISKSELLPEKPFPVLTAGPQNNNILPTQVAAEVYWPTITPKVRTATFVGGYTVTALAADGAITAAALGRLLSFGQALQEWNVPDIDAFKGSWNPTKFVFTEAGLPITPARWRTQRRRRVGVGS